VFVVTVNLYTRKSAAWLNVFSWCLTLMGLT